jgi:hypothetical protein
MWFFPIFRTVSNALLHHWPGHNTPAPLDPRAAADPATVVVLAAPHDDGDNSSESDSDWEAVSTFDLDFSYAYCEDCFAWCEMCGGVVVRARGLKRMRDEEEDDGEVGRVEDEKRVRRE